MPLPGRQAATIIYEFGRRDARRHSEVHEFETLQAPGFDDGVELGAERRPVYFQSLTAQRELSRWMRLAMGGEGERHDPVFRQDRVQ